MTVLLQGGSSSGQYLSVCEVEVFGYEVDLAKRAQAARLQRQAAVVAKASDIVEPEALEPLDSAAIVCQPPLSSVHDGDSVELRLDASDVSWTAGIIRQVLPDGRLAIRLEPDPESGGALERKNDGTLADVDADDATLATVWARSSGLDPERVRLGSRTCGASVALP